MGTGTRRAGIAMTTALLVSASCQASATEFSSVYTDLQKDCRAAFHPDDDSGGDAPRSCKGFDGYAVSIDYGACAVQVSIRKGSFDLVFPVQSLDVETRKLEWRLADGKPFAVILRIEEHDSGEDVCERGKKAGEALMIRGLQGFMRINHRLRVGKTPDINAEARQMADQGFASEKAR
jgi:hypothetical protein